MWLARIGEDLRDRAAGRLGDQRVGIEQRPAQARSQQPADAGFTHAAQANQRDRLRILHWSILRIEVCRMIAHSEYRTTTEAGQLSGNLSTTRRHAACCSSSAPESAQG